jgi:serine/threonine protein kinase
MSKQSNYELFEELGRGENSVVHRAYDLVLGRDVAIKTLTPESSSNSSPANVQRSEQFLKEAGFLAQFEHENVLRIHAVDQERGWIIMELMKGTLESQIAAAPMHADMVRSVLRQMLNALDFLHQKNKVHGAVRPSNILINEHGTVKLSDFEASSRDGELRAPSGSKKYLSPELIRSDFGEFGPAVDLYCLGFTVLELLTGAKFNSLFPGTGEGAIDADVAWLRWHSSEEPMRSVREIDKSIPDDLAAVIDGLLKKPVDERPQTAAAVLALLDETPLVPVAVPDAASPVQRQEDVQKILPTKAVKLPPFSWSVPVPTAFVSECKVSHQ